MGNWKPLVIGDLTVKYPIVQGGMGVGISLSGLAGAVAKAGGMGIISAAQIGFREPDFGKYPKEANLRAIQKEMKKARAEAPDGVIGFNIMAAMKNYALYVKEAVKAGADIIISGAGLPVRLPEYVEGSKTKTAPIVSSAKAASVICRMWDKKYKTTPDMVVVEGPLAGGHLGFSKEELTEYGADTLNASETFKKELYETEIRKIIDVVKAYGEKYGKKIPVVTAGGIFSREDVKRQMELGADGVQVGTRFVTTEECDASEGYKQAYINASEKDIIIVKSPVGMPGRAIKNAFLERVSEGKETVSKCYGCLEHCNPKETPYCITKALINAAEGDTENALLFCGSNAYKCTKIETAEQVIRDLCSV